MKLLLPIIFMTIVLGCKHQKPVVTIQKDIDSIANKWVPDIREGICAIDISLQNSEKILVKGETNLPAAKNEIDNYLAKSGYDYSDSILLLPSAGLNGKTWGLISISVCNIKKTPSHSSELVSQAVMGTPVKILKKKGGWLLIQTPDFYIGWANDSGLEEFNEQQIHRWMRSDRVVFIKKWGEIQDESGSDTVVSDIVFGGILEVSAENKSSYFVLLPDGRKGALKKNDVVNFKHWSDVSSPVAENLITFAKSQLGTPYLWGGTSTKAFDCSGFTKTIYLTSGVILARDASQQYQYGKPLEINTAFDNLKKGDLIFFGNNSKGKKRISHVGMYIGNTEVIHCSGMVRINSLDSTRSNFSKYLKDTFIVAERFIGNESGKGFEKIANNSWYFNPEP